MHLNAKEAILVLYFIPLIGLALLVQAEVQWFLSRSLTWFKPKARGHILNAEHVSTMGVPKRKSKVMKT